MDLCANLCIWILNFWRTLEFYSNLELKVMVKDCFLFSTSSVICVKHVYVGRHLEQVGS